MALHHPTQSSCNTICNHIPLMSLQTNIKAISPGIHVQFMAIFSGRLILFISCVAAHSLATSHFPLALPISAHANSKSRKQITSVKMQPRIATGTATAWGGRRHMGHTGTPTY